MPYKPRLQVSLFAASCRNDLNVIEGDRPAVIAIKTQMDGLYLSQLESSNRLNKATPWEAICREHGLDEIGFVLGGIERMPVEGTR